MTATTRRIAIVDDSRIVLKLVKHVLGKAGHEVIAMSEPRQRDLLGDGSVDLILVDVNMPEVLGDDLPLFFKEAWGIQAPTYLFSDIPEDELRSRAKQAGADGYICKAWGPEELVRRVAQALDEASS